MSRRLTTTLLLIAALLTAGAASAATKRGHAPAKPGRSFSTKNFSLKVARGQLIYSLTICTPVKSTLAVSGTLTPLRPGTGVTTAKPGSTQYQDKGCWPAQVSAPVRKTQGSCSPVFCAVIAGQRYRGSVVVTDRRTHQSQRTPVRLAKA